MSIRYKLGFTLNFSPIFTSNIMWHVILWYPCDNSEVSPSHVLNSGWTFFIYLHMASYQTVFPLYSSNDFASATDLGIFAPNL